MTELNNTVPGFDALGLPDFIFNTLTKMGFEKPTPIQAQTIPPLLEGKHVLGEAQTGTGKTAAFGLPALAKLDMSIRKPQMMVLAPTRELAMQVAEAIESFGKDMKGLRVATLYGGQSYGPQLSQLERGAQVVVGTPGRLMDHLRRKTLKLDSLTFCALDEADEMLNMGFLEDIEWILEHLPNEAQMALFSATMPPAIRKVANRFLVDPVHIKVAAVTKAKANITQLAWKVTGINKNTAIERIVETFDYEAMIIFVRTRNDTITISEQIERLGYPCAALNGDLNQAQRERTVEQLKNGKVSIVVATDVVARGLDIPRIDLVLNYDIPGDHESYVHRIGRTGRAGREGTAITFIRPREMYNIRHYERLTAGTIKTFELPTVSELGAIRIERCRKSLVETAQNKDLTTMRAALEKMAADSEVSIEDLAAALLFEKQIKQPFEPKEDPKPRRERSERDSRGRDSRDSRDSRDTRGRGRDDRGNRGERPQRERKQSSGARSDIDWQAYRIEVGKEHGARPGDIVGAIANEISLDSAYIGQINLQDNHTIVQLPKGMPKDAFEKLRNVRVRRQQLDISVSDAKVETQTRRPRNDRPRNDRRNDRPARHN
ncbi:DEAD/DEAH box helicase [Thalassomonas sp. M1454]|uniref:DEAD/DEAH box helicase n=1 Tax=Thalassomonas sp. M1454 TaxID=2594477 RepID=UPI00117FD2B3|nr:DEAD/DEAH box helicase [Thalassomonas sp. M1454]TRX55745.1 DEAD/DEAH box helicase [Thalassomonas sp. M1454]